MRFIAGLFIFTVLINSAWASLALERSRLVYNEGDKSISLNIKSHNSNEPYLVQSWLEDADGNKIQSPFMMLPPLQRIEPDAKTTVRIQLDPKLAQLSQSQESIFYVNIRGIPVKTDKKNVLTLALQNRIKMFYRPKSLKVDDKVGLINEYNSLKIKKNKAGYQIINPTHYHITVVEIRNSETREKIKDFEALMLAPDNRVDINSTYSAKQLELTIINDYGGVQQVNINVG